MNGGLRGSSDDFCMTLGGRGGGSCSAFYSHALHKMLTSACKLHWQKALLLAQVRDEAESIASSSGMEVRVTALTASGAAEREQFLHIGQIVISTPGRIAQVPTTQL